MNQYNDPRAAQYGTAPSLSIKSMLGSDQKYDGPKVSPPRDMPEYDQALNQLVMAMENIEATQQRLCEYLSDAGVVAQVPNEATSGGAVPAEHYSAAKPAQLASVTNRLMRVEQELARLRNFLVI